MKINWTNPRIATVEITSPDTNISTSIYSNYAIVTVSNSRRRGVNIWVTFMNNNTTVHWLPHARLEVLAYFSAHTVILESYDENRYVYRVYIQAMGAIRIKHPNPNTQSHSLSPVLPVGTQGDPRFRR